MELSGYSVMELITHYSETIRELKKRGILRTNNVVGEIGEFYVLEKYNADKKLPTLRTVPVGTKNINAIDQNGERYSIKSTSGNVTGAFYGLQAPNSTEADKPLFEYVVICKLDENYGLEGIYQVSWDIFLKHKRWHTRIKAWNLTLTSALIKDAVVVYEKVETKKETVKPAQTRATKTEPVFPAKENVEKKKKVKAVSWGKTPNINHTVIRDETAERISDCIGEKFEKESHSRYVSQNREKALYIMSSKYSEKNSEYWYSINDENLPWMELFEECYVAFAMGSSSHVLVFSYSKIREMLKGCLKTVDDESIGKKAHYHFSFAVEGKKHIYFKKKLPEREFVDVTDALLENLR